MVSTVVEKGGIGDPVLRKEDLRFVRGRGQYGSDQTLDNMAHAVFVRTPHAHARIVKIDTAAAKSSAGVLGVWTGADLVAAGCKPMPHGPNWEGIPDVKLNLRAEVFLTEHEAMPAKIVHFCGEPVVMVVAETLTQAKDAAEKVTVDYEVLPAIVHAADAIKPGAPNVWPHCPTNISLDAEVGDKAAVDAAFAKAKHVTRLETWIQRVTGSPMEPRVAIGEYDPATQMHSVWAGTGSGVVRERAQLAGTLDIPYENARAWCKDMGGNFGTRNTFFPEYALTPFAAKQLGRPVKWVGERNECFLTDYQGRDLKVEAELALDADGNFLAVRGFNISNIGAYAAHFTPLRKGLGIMQGVYKIPAVHFRGCAVFTNTVPTTPYRSAGRPEAIYVIERIIDKAAREHGFDPVELRRKNFIRPNQMPYTNAVGITYDNGEYEYGMDVALKLADLPGLPARKAAAKKRGKLLGLGVANYLEGAGGAPRERAEVTIQPEGRTELVLGTMNSGQGHETSFAQLLNTWLGVPFETIDYVAHDTKRVAAGGGSHSGRSMRIASIAMGEASDQIIEKGKDIASHLLEAARGDIEFSKGLFSVKGTDRKVGIFEVAKAAATNDKLPENLRGKLDGVGDHTVKVGAFPSGTHICEVEVDPDTGEVQIVAWYGADDVGLAVNPMILHGQTHGAVVQGAGQALFEHTQFDSNGTMLSATFMDYAMPRASDMPSFTAELIEVPATSHRYGIRPGGEGGTTPSLGAVVNAVVDALSELGVRHVEMPVTAPRVWRAIQEAKAGK
jgi:carbon-monoxide dehydrogenase large subunit